MQKHNSKIRKANALAAALLTAFFLAHALLGAFSRLFLNADAPTIIVWAFIFVAFVHIALCLITSRLMLTDTVRPPSRKKKNHLWLKWASGPHSQRARLLMRSGGTPPHDGSSFSCSRF